MFIILTFALYVFAGVQQKEFLTHTAGFILAKSSHLLCLPLGKLFLSSILIAVMSCSTMKLHALIPAISRSTHLAILFTLVVDPSPCLEFDFEVDWE